MLIALAPKLGMESQSRRPDPVSSDLPLNRRDDYLYTLFVPVRAHEAFPCFDQPDLKARFALSLTIPAAAIPATIRGAKASKSARDSQKSMIPQPPSIGPEA